MELLDRDSCLYITASSSSIFIRENRREGGTSELRSHSGVPDSGDLNDP